ncbi:MAG: nucleoside hydrolase [Propionibacteriaceae bacterium]|nr:nucleoside hydrolase [Propionibacteriaceae bacterium]
MTLDLILDVDTGIDDALALIYAAAHPDVAIRAVTCVAGNAGLDAVVRNTRGVLDLMGRSDVPVAAGAASPLLGDARPATWVHGRNGIADIDLAEFGVTPRDAAPIHAVELLRQSIEQYPGATVVVLGPMTNLALALRMYPHLAEQIHRVAVMGGGFTIGNATATAEFNIWHDPEAAQICFASGVPHLLYGLDVFYGARTSKATHEQLRAGGPVGELAARLLDALGAVYSGETRVATGEYFSCLGDAGLLTSLVRPEVLSTEVYPVNVSLHDPLTRGQTVVDRRYVHGRESFLPIQHRRPLVEVGVAIDGDACVADFVSTVLSGS